MEKVILVVFQNNRPWMITTIKDGRYGETYDVDYCKKENQLYYHCVGSGSIITNEIFVDGQGDYWLDKKYEPIFNPGCKEGKRLTEINDEYKKYPSEYCIKLETVFCDVCNDNIPTNDESPCDHIFWDEDIGWSSDDVDKKN